MGLDMYLEGHKYYHHNKRPTEDNLAVKEQVLELAYWRKHPNLHGFIVQTFADGKDECREVELGAEQIELLIEAVKECKLPDTTGFFFGQSTGSERAEDLKVLTAALAWVRAKDETCMKYITYRASW